MFRLFKQKRFILLLIVFFVFLNSCSSIYTSEPPITQQPVIEVASDSEYFTEGNIVSKGGQIDGFVYKNSWIYVEYQNYQRYIKTLSTGEKVYADDNVQRIVKLNTLTGKVSSACLDPLCTHSPGSDCIMMAPQNSIASIDKIR